MSSNEPITAVGVFPDRVHAGSARPMRCSSSWRVMGTTNSRSSVSCVRRPKPARRAAPTRRWPVPGGKRF